MERLISECANESLLNMLLGNEILLLFEPMDHTL